MADVAARTTINVVLQWQGCAYIELQGGFRGRQQVYIGLLSELRRDWHVRERSVIRGLLLTGWRALHMRLGWEMFSGMARRPTVVIYADEIACVALHNDLAQVWAQVLDSLQYLAQEATDKDVDSLLTCLVSDSVECGSLLRLHEVFKGVDRVHAQH